MRAAPVLRPEGLDAHSVRRPEPCWGCRGSTSTPTFIPYAGTRRSYRKLSGSASRTNGSVASPLTSRLASYRMCIPQRVELSWAGVESVG